MKRLFASGFVSKTIITLLLIGLLSSCVQFSAQCSEISSKVLRLHILANSDSSRDQSLKLMLRDKILENSAELLGSPSSKEEAICTASCNLKKIEKFCNDTLASFGSENKASCRIVSNMYFDTRTYDDNTMPAGFYDALRITIGRGEGKNWWCVLFPPICLSCAVEQKNVFDKDDEEILNDSEDYEYRFFILEAFDYIKSLF